MSRRDATRDGLSLSLSLSLSFHAKAPDFLYDSKEERKRETRPKEKRKTQT